jgi:hypothetical protein
MSVVSLCQLRYEVFRPSYVVSYETLFRRRSCAWGSSGCASVPSRYAAVLPLGLPPPNRQPTLHCGVCSWLPCLRPGAAFSSQWRAPVRSGGSSYSTNSPPRLNIASVLPAFALLELVPRAGRVRRIKVVGEQRAEPRHAVGVAGETEPVSRGRLASTAWPSANG